MIPAEVADIARKRVAIEMEQRRHSTGVEVSRIYSEVTKAGMLQSGRTVVMMRESLENEYRARAAIALGVWRRALGSAAIAPTKALRPDLVDEIERALERDSEDIPEHYQRALTVSSSSPGTNPQQVLLTMRAKALEWVASEIDFDIAAVSNAQARQGTTTLNIYGGQVGAIQTGPGATATITQSDIEQVLRALEAAKRAVLETAEIPEVEKAQIVEVVDEATTEARKPKPNRLALRSLLSGVATSVQTLGAARPAYEILKGALALLGVSLP